MGIFKRDFNKPGPGVPKNAPRKKGVGRFFEVAGRNFGDLVKLNFLCVLCVLPALLVLFLAFASAGRIVFWLLLPLGLLLSLLTGAALTAINYIIARMLRDETGFLWYDFKRVFVESFRTTVLPGVVYVLLLAVQMFSLTNYIALGGQADFVVMVLLAFSALVLAMVAPYYFLQAACIELGNVGLLKNSVILAVANAPRSILGAVLGTGLLLLQLFLLPYSALVLVLLGCSFPLLMNLVCIWPPVDKTFKIEETLKAKSAGDEGQETAE